MTMITNYIGRLCINVTKFTIVFFNCFNEIFFNLKIFEFINQNILHFHLVSLSINFNYYIMYLDASKSRGREEKIKRNT